MRTARPDLLPQSELGVKNPLGDIPEASLPCSFPAVQGLTLPKTPCASLRSLTGKRRPLGQVSLTAERPKPSSCPWVESGTSESLEEKGGAFGRLLAAIRSSAPAATAPLTAFSATGWRNRALQRQTDITRAIWVSVAF